MDSPASLVRLHLVEGENNKHRLLTRALQARFFFFCRWMRYGGAFTGILTKILCRVTYRCVLSLNLVIKCGLDGEFRFLLWIASALSFAFGSAQPFCD